MCTHPCFTHQTPQVVHVATTAQEKMKSWRRPSRSSKSTMSSRCGLAANRQSTACEGRVYLCFFSALLIIVNDYVDVSDIMMKSTITFFYAII
jgi:hypothetical protein